MYIIGCLASRLKPDNVESRNQMIYIGCPMYKSSFELGQVETDKQFCHCRLLSTVN